MGILIAIVFVERDFVTELIIFEKLKTINLVIESMERDENSDWVSSELRNEILEISIRKRRKTEKFRYPRYILSRDI